MKAIPTCCRVSGEGATVGAGTGAEPGHGGYREGPPAGAALGIGGATGKGGGAGRGFGGGGTSTE